jgi:predicted DCC family thiol-disulfide oxidoreductase YuxK
VLLYDGLCGFCDRTVQTILKHDRRGTMRFAPLQGPFAQGVLSRHGALAGVDSLILVEGPPGQETVSVRTEAVVRIADYLGGAWNLVKVLRIIPRPLRDLGYDGFAKVRYRVFGRYNACPVPSAETRARFID